jgi:hypothetical protein
MKWCQCWVKAIRRERQRFGWKPSVIVPVIVDLDSAGSMWWAFFHRNSVDLIENAACVRLCLMDRVNECFSMASTSGTAYWEERAKDEGQYWLEDTDWVKC